MKNLLNIDKAALQAALKNTFPVFTGYLLLGFGFGVLWTTKDLPTFLAPIASIAIYAGALQYLAVEMLASHWDYFTIALTTLLVNARHLFYGLSLIDRYKNQGLKKIYLAWGLTDETYSLITSHPHDENFKNYYFYVTLLDHLYWIFGSSLGVIAGKLLPFDATGMDFALTALFIAIMTEQWQNTDRHFGTLIGIISTLICLMIFGEKNFLIAAMILIGIALLGVRPYEKRRRL